MNINGRVCYCKSFYFIQQFLLSRLTKIAFADMKDLETLPKYLVIAYVHVALLDQPLHELGSGEFK